MLNASKKSTKTTTTTTLLFKHRNYFKTQRANYKQNHNNLNHHNNINAQPSNKLLHDLKTIKISSNNNNVKNIPSDSNVKFIWYKKHGKSKSKSNALSGKIST